MIKKYFFGDALALRSIILCLNLLGFIANSFAQEICNNGIDDDGDGYIDCFDNDCTGNQACADFYYGAPSPSCQFIPPNSNLSLATQWTGGPVSGHSVLVTGDLDGDGFPEIVARNQNLISAANQQGLGGANGIRIFDGRDGSLKFTPNTLHIPFTNTGFVIADSDQDGKGEFYYITAWNTPGGDDRKLVCYEYNSTTKAFDLRWKSSVQIGNSNAGVFYSPEIADFNQDGVPELYVGNQIFNSSNGNEICNGGLSNSKGWSNCEFFHPAAFSIAFDVLTSSSVLPSTGNPCGAPCNGLELVAGNVVYSVDISSGVMNIAIQAPATVPDGNTTLLDYDLDGDIDAAITSIQSGGAKLFIWDLQTSSLLANPLTLQTVDNMGRANVGDFDNDGKPELGICTERFYRVIDDYTQISGGNLTYLWTLSTSDNSGMTNATVFDFDGNGSFEIVYRDEQNLRILKGLDGTQLASIPCSSPTAGEYPLVADIDADGETELVCACGGVVNGQIKAFKSNNKPWIAARKVWNQHSYFNVNINEDLTVPRVQQMHHKEFPAHGSGRRPLNIFLAQSTILDSSGRIAFPASDATIDIHSTDCVNDSIEVQFYIKNLGLIRFPNQAPVSVYSSNPLFSNAQLIKSSLTNQIIDPNDSILVTIMLAKNFSQAFIVVNDNASLSRPYSLQTQFPVTSIGECNFLNNLDSVFLTGTGNQTTVNRDLCYGDTITLNDNFNPNYTYLWSGSSNISNPNDPNPDIFPLSSDTITLFEQNAICPSSTLFYINVVPRPNINITPKINEICLGDSLNLVVAGNDYLSFFWSINTTNLGSANPFIFSPSQDAYILANADNGVCISKDSVWIKVNPLPQYSPLNDTVACLDAKLKLGYGQGISGQSYSWTPNTNLTKTDSSSTIYTLEPGVNRKYIRITLGNCSVYDTIQITSTVPPSGDILSDTVYCENDTLELNFTSSLLYTYNWKPGFTLQDSTTSSIKVLPDYKGYLVRTISDGGCASEDSFYLDLRTKPKLRIYTKTEAICNGDSLRISLAGGGLYSIPQFSINQNPDSVYKFLPSAQEVLKITVDSGGCATTDSIPIIFADDPMLDLDSAYWLCPNEAFNLFEAEAGVNYTYLNPFGQKVLAPDSSGTYTIIAYNGCSQNMVQFDVFTTTQSNCELHFPNAFTPDRNGINDQYPFGAIDMGLYIPCRIQAYQFKIYTRWGELVFETEDPTKQWDGIFKGKEAEAGVFIWYVQYTLWDACEGGPIKLNKKGNLTLIR